MSSRKISLTTIVIMVITVVIITISSTVSPTTSTPTPVAFGQRTVIDSEQSVTVTTNGIGQNNNNNNNTATGAHTNASSLMITQIPENGLDLDCEGDLLCEILNNHTLVATTDTGENTTNMTITSALDTLNQSFTQSLNQSNMLPLPFGDDDFNDMLNDDFGIFNEHEDLDTKIDEWVDRMLNGTLGDLAAPLQPPPDLLPISV
jgi:hypothetical protein